MTTLWIALKALLFMNGFFLLWGWVALRLRPLDRHIPIALPGWTKMAGVGVMAAGGILALMCVGIFVAQGRGTPAPFDAPTAFVATGPYRYVRNPMYIGGSTVLIGLGLYLRSNVILLFSAAWFLLAHLFVVYLEEPDLKRKFGATYTEYCRTVPRWIPK